MVGHAFRVNKFPRNVHESDGKHLAALHQFIHDCVFILNIDLHLELGRAPPPYLIGPSNPATTETVH